MNRSRIIRRLGILVAVVWCAAMATAQHPATDSIDGDWTVTFTVQGQTVSGQMAFHAHGEKLSGTVETAHTGRGTLQGGAWLQEKISGICVFEKHPAIALAGELRDGKLAGTFQTEGMGGSWEAVRSGSAAP
jgi:hypothetical protein